MASWLPPLVLLALSGAPPRDAGTVERSPPQRQEACLDAWVRAHGLNAYGDPSGTSYAGGTPLFNEATGRREDRVHYILRRHPEARKACP